MAAQRVVVASTPSARGPARQSSPGRRRGGRRGERGVDHQREQLVLGRDVAVERHGGRRRARAATRLIDTAARPSAAATSTAAATIRSRLSAGFGPCAGRSRRPQAASMLAGRPVPVSARPSGSLTRHTLTVYNVRSMRMHIRSRARRGGDDRRSGDRGHRPGEVLRRRARCSTGSTCGSTRGSVFALLGPNGAGKTTTVRILATLIRARRRPGPRRRLRRRRRPPAGPPRDQPHRPVRGASTSCRPARRTCG